MSSLSWCIVVSLWGGWWEGSRLASSGGPADVNVKLEKRATYARAKAPKACSKGRT